MIQLKTLLKGVGQVVQEEVGQYLSKTGNEPSVYIARRAQPYLNYPFIIIDKIAGGTSGGWGLARWIDDDGLPNYENTYTYILSVQIYDKAGEFEDDVASDVINKLRDRLLQLPRIRRKIKEYSQGTLEQILEVTDRTFATKDGFVKSYGFNLTLITTSLIVDTQSEFIEEVEVAVEVFADDPTPLTILIEQSLLP